MNQNCLYAEPRVAAVQGEAANHYTNHTSSIGYQLKRCFADKKITCFIAIWTKLNFAEL